MPDLQHNSLHQLHLWRDAALQGAHLASAHYQSHLTRLFKRAYGVAPGVYAGLREHRFGTATRGGMKS